MKNIKAIMCDVDGTLLTDDGVVSPFTIEMIKRVREKGILFGLSTGRDVNSVQTLLKTWGIDGLVDSIVGFRVIIVIEANSYVNIKSSRLLPKFKTQKINSWCAA